MAACSLKLHEEVLNRFKTEGLNCYKYVTFNTDNWAIVLQLGYAKSKLKLACILPGGYEILWASDNKFCCTQVSPGAVVDGSMDFHIPVCWGVPVAL